MKHKKAYLIHPLGFATLPVLSLYLENADAVVLQETVRAIAFLPLIALTAYLLVGYLMKDYSKSALLASISLSLIFLYRGLYESFYYLLGSLEIWRFGGYAALGSIILIWVALAIAVAKATSIPRPIHHAMNAAALGLLITLVVPILREQHAQSPDRYEPPHEMTYDAVLNGSPLRAGSLPDIIYIVLDRYPNNDTLRNIFQFDNTRFTTQLKARGFFVAEHAFANYAKTYQSLASMLNMSHLPGALDHGSTSGLHNLDVYELLQNHRVQRLLRKNGYKFVHMGSSWGPTSSNRFADENVPGVNSWVNEFEVALLKMTPVLDIRAKLRAWQGLSPHLEECERVLNQIEYLRDVGDEHRPTFVFAHILVPHGPFRFDEYGNCIFGPSMERGGLWEDFKRYFVAQVKFINQRMLSVIDDQMTKNARKVVFILQSDEGPFPPAYYESESTIDWEIWTPTDFATKYGILNAMYWSDGDYDTLSRTLTPVNNWRLIFNEVLGTGLPTVQNRAYGFEIQDGRLEFFDVTSAVERGLGEWMNQNGPEGARSLDVPGSGQRQRTIE